MADNPNKKKADSKRISKQPHEQAYQKERQLNQEAKRRKLHPADK
jgi:hypothetical protein